MNKIKMNKIKRVYKSKGNTKILYSSIFPFDIAIVKIVVGLLICVGGSFLIFDGFQEFNQNVNNIVQECSVNGAPFNTITNLLIEFEENNIGLQAQINILVSYRDYLHNYVINASNLSDVQEEQLKRAIALVNQLIEDRNSGNYATVSKRK